MSELKFYKINDTTYKVEQPFDDAAPMLVGFLRSCSGGWHYEQSGYWKLNKQDMFCIAEHLRSLDLHGK